MVLPGVLQEGHRSVEGEAAEARRRRAQAAARRALMVARRAEEARNARAPRPFGGCVHQGAACVHAVSISREVVLVAILPNIN